VSGLITPEAADSTGTSYSKTQQFSMLATEYSDHVPKMVLKETFLPTNFYPWLQPALMTSPNPSRPAIKFG